LLAKEKTMSTFTVDAENNITAFPNATDASECNPGPAQFDSQAGLAKLSADWPLSRFVEIWNSLPGNAEVKKLGDRKKAVARIWEAILPLASDRQTRPEAKPKEPAKGAKSAKNIKAAKKAAPAKKASRKPKSDRSNKKAEVIAMLQRAKGATLEEIMNATDWQCHTVRGFPSILGSKGGEKIESSKNAAGERTYKITK
jgi:hypothetical protein